MLRFVSKPCSNLTSQLCNLHSASGTQHSMSASSKYFNFRKPIQPDLVISFLKNHGFNHSQIKKLVTNYPPILCSKPEKTLLPKIQYLKSKGFEEKDLATTLLVIPEFFRRSLEKCIVPSFSFIKDILGSEKDVVFAILDCPRILLEVESRVKPNIEILRGAGEGEGMSHSAIACLLRTRPSVFVSSQDKLKESIRRVRSMKMDTESCGYGLALWILTSVGRLRADPHERMEAYKRWGCSEDDVLMSFKICPNMMRISEERLNGIMSLFVNEIGWEASEVVKRYFIFTLSLNRRLIPRWSVYRELVSKGLVKKKVCMSTMFVMKEYLFLEKFVNVYKDEAPLLLKLYIEKKGSK